MNAALGELGILSALVGATWLVVAARGEVKGAVGRVARPVVVLVGGAAVTMLALQLALLADDFSIAYVINNSRSTTPLVFKVSSAWAALEGSIVLWGLVLAGFTLMVFRQHRRNPDPLGAGALMVLGGVALFFFGMMATIANPFELCTQAIGASCVDSTPVPWADAIVVADGRGPNPLLQNHLLMAIHPPVLYVGYVGLTVPFAFAISALALAQPGIAWARRTKAWTLAAWSFLTVGILLGGWWSYEVLGWGGYWAWDPVENASFLPWLAATAFIHSSFVQMRRGMLQAWNFVLIIGAFSLTILGTFLTRSGAIASVHSFTQSSIGPVLLGFLALVLIGSFGLFARRAHVVAQSPRLESLMSREGAFLANNLLLTVFGAVVLIGTLFPLFVEAFTGDTVGVGRPFFDRFAVPLSFALLLAMGTGPLMPYRIARASIVWERIRVPLRLALGVGAALVILGLREAWPLLSIVAASYVIAAIGAHLLRLSRAGATKRDESLGSSALRVIRSDAGFWGGQLSHIGVAVLAIGIAGSSGLASTHTVSLEPGQRGEFAGYEFTYVRPFTSQDDHRVVTGASIEVARGETGLGIVRPRVNEFQGQAQAVPTPGVLSRVSGDLYFTIIAIDGTGVTLDVWWFPLQWMVWLGGLIAGLGGMWSTVMRRAGAQRVETRSSVRPVTIDG